MTSAEIKTLTAKIKRQTARNFHTNALQTLLAAFEVCADMRAEAKKIAAEHKKVGWLEYETAQRRDALIREALERVKGLMSARDFQSLYMSF